MAWWRLLRQLLKDSKSQIVINSDQGARFTIHEYVNYINRLGSSRTFMDRERRAAANVNIERFFRISTTEGFIDSHLMARSQN